MQELERPQDFGIKQMISLTCLLGQINIKDLCRYVKATYWSLNYSTGLLRHLWWANTLLQMKIKLTAHSEGWEWWGGTTQTISTQTRGKWDLPLIPSVLYSLFPLPCLFTPRKASAAFPDFPAFQYFSKSLFNGKCILKPEVSFLCHTTKGNRNLQSAFCKYTQRSLKNNSRSKT